MSQADVDLLRSGFEAFATEGIDAVIGLSDPDIEILTPAIPGAERFRGHAGLRQSLDDQLEAFEEWTVTPEEFIDLGEHVVVVVRQHARGRGSGISLDTHSAWVFTLRGGKAVRLAIHVTKDEALEAVRQDQTRRQ